MMNTKRITAAHLSQTAKKQIKQPEKKNIFLSGNNGKISDDFTAKARVHHVLELDIRKTKQQKIFKPINKNYITNTTGLCHKRNRNFISSLSKLLTQSPLIGSYKLDKMQKPQRLSRVTKAITDPVLLYILGKADISLISQ